MYRFILCGVEVRRRFKPRRAIRNAITALDLKICDLEEHLEDNRYRSSNHAVVELSQILGEIKFMYMMNLLTPNDYRRIAYRLTGKETEEVEDE